MKKIKLFLLLFLFGIIHHSYAQSNFQSYEAYLNSKRNSIIFAPFNLLDIINPSLQIGYERMLNHKFAVQIEGAYIINHSVENYLIDLANGIKDCEYTNRGFKIRGEFKYYFSKGNSFKPYLSSELFYLKNISKVMETFIASDTTVIYPTLPDYKYYQDFITIDKQRFGLNLKIGFKLFAGENFYFEPHTGIGLVYRISKHYDRENINDELANGFLSFSSKAGKMWIANLPLNMKIGYRF